MLVVTPHNGARRQIVSQTVPDAGDAPDASGCEKPGPRPDLELQSSKAPYTYRRPNKPAVAAMHTALLVVLASPALGFVPPLRSPLQRPLRSDEVDDADCLDDCLAEDEYDEPVPRTVAPLLDGPVYSLATLDEAGDTNMNVVTYATPVGIRPERRWALSLFKSTVSRANFARRRRGVLQLLRPEHAPLVYALGGTSAADADKAAACYVAGFAWESSDWDERVLPRCAAYVSLEAVGEPVDCGDHEVYVCRVVDGVAGFDASHATTGDLRERGLITTEGRARAPGDVPAPPKPGRGGLKRLLGAVAAAAVVALLPLRASAAEFRTKPGALCAALAGAQSIVDADSSGRWVGGTPAPSRVEAPK